MRWNSEEQHPRVSQKRHYATALLSLAFVLAMAGCASKCKQALTKCRYECERNYQLCQVKNTDAWYCQIQVGNCDLKCDDDNKSCSNWHFW